MAKEPESVLRFMIHVTLEPDQLGIAVAALSRLGITELQHEVIEEVATFRKNKPKKQAPRKKRAAVERKIFDKNASDVILAHARKHSGKFNTQQLLPVFAKQDRARNSIYATINHLMVNKLIKRTGKGEYLLLAKGNGAAEAAHG
jgi:hypothetical protein